ncbi:glycoside hydrolase family 2 TIM barrel-domain containing protein [Microbacterium radiodurans]|uniref:Beta-galactosidase n=1 Tax=Microbacterium radiodurans TaxID=661398 RepID=A0A5J5IWP7_9MICO|nr:glycoside hydrolase family 2 TIM barrel-domain containing protein [Microbacterium radiodurans]KAA9089561.1 DUF4981 domain-containing protein [Microbacterium radiodurans]
MTYWESTEPGAGRRSPRADAVTDARVLDLSGTWRFRLAPTAAGTGEAFLGADFDASGWDEIRVPSHWVLEEITPLAGGPARSLLGTAEGPLYTNTAYPIPLDPPRVSTENPTGDYRLVFDVPADFGAAVLRFQGVDSCAKVWLNGRELGWSSGSRLPFEFDAPVEAGRNVLAVRVHRWSSGTYLEDQDMWWLPGIFREVELIARPEGAIDDHTVHADYDAATGLGTLRVEASTAATVEIPELGIRMPAGETATVAVAPWSADSPRLYRGTLSTAGESVELAIGFRTVAIVDGVFTVNGRAVVFRGVNRHEHHPRTGRTLDRETMLSDILMMKRANVDAVRTSHYPPHPEFLRLCDEYGLWVVAECDLETHGFIYAGWEGNPPAEPVWRDALMDRLRRTVERDKNHPSIVVWSLANESWVGETFGDMRRWLDERDPSRTVLYERDPSYRDSDFSSLMYPSLELLELIGRREEPRGGRVGMHGLVFDGSAPPVPASARSAPGEVSEADDERRRGLPFLLVEYAHAQGNGPGSLSDYWRIIRAHERLCGAFVWEWIDHGFTAVDDSGGEHIMHGDDVDYEPRGGRFGLHGLVFSDRTPTPGLVELAKAHEPFLITIDVDGVGGVEIANDRHSADTADIRWRWSLSEAGVEVAAGDLDVLPLAAGMRAQLPLPARVRALARADVGDPSVLTIEAVLADDARWAPAGHVLAWSQAELASAASWPHVPAVTLDRRVAASAPSVATAGSILHLGPGEFDAGTGRIRRLGALVLDGPSLDLHRAPTENDHGQGETNNIAAVWVKTGMDRMLHRVDAVEVADAMISVRGRTAPAAHPHAARWSMTWRVDADDARALVLDVVVDFEGPWVDTPYQHRDIWVPRVGLLFALPGAAAEVEWLGRGPGETYRDSFEGSRFGRWRSSIDAMQTPYPVPQENGNHVQTRRLRVSGDGIPDLRVDGMPEFDFTARRWTSLDLQRAQKPHELRDSGRVWLNLDAGQQGIGSASVGPALPERYRMPRERTTWSLRLSAG